MPFQMDLSLRRRLILTGVILAIVPIFALGWLIRKQFTAASDLARSAGQTLEAANLHDTVDTLLKSVETANSDAIEPLGLARATLNGSGGLSISRRRATWQVTNEITGEHTRVKVPVAVIGKWSKRQARQPRRELVDEIHDLAGVTCTIFERMNPAGDMLRIATTITGADGKRATGTFIPAFTANGQANPAVAAALKGQRYTDVVEKDGQEYDAAFDAIVDAHGETVGMLYVTRPRPAREQLIQAALSRVALPAHSEVFGLYAKGTRTGELSFWHGTSGREPGAAERGRLVRDAMAHSETTAQERYVSAQGVRMAVELAPVNHGECVLAVAVPEDEYLLPATGIEALGVRTGARVWILLALSVLVSVLFWTRYARLIEHVFSALAGCLRDEGQRLIHSTAVMGRLTKQLLARSAERVPAIEKVVEAGRVVEHVAHANRAEIAEALKSAGDSDGQVQAASEYLKAMQTSIGEIVQSNDRIAGVMRTIDEIAFQSKILALNASIEAARAGNAGVSFAVVADEFGVLARRCAEAANTTTDLLTDCVARTRNGDANLLQLSSAVNKISENSGAVKDRMRQAQLGADEQARSATHAASAIAGLQQLLEADTERTHEVLQAAKSVHGQARSLRFGIDGLADVRSLKDGSKARGSQEVKTVTLPPAKRLRASGVKGRANNRSARRAY